MKYLTRLLPLTFAFLLLTFDFAPAASLARDDYLFFELEARDGGDARPSELREAVAQLRREHPAGVRNLVLMVHGYDTGAAKAQEYFSELAERLNETLPDRGRETAIVGVHWDSNPGAVRSQVFGSVGRALARAVGLGRHAPKDPYFRMQWRARGVGRRGVRQLALTLQDAFPGAATHFLAHSMGTWVTLNALAPDLTPDEVDEGHPAFAPGEELRVDLAMMAGSDIDADLFVGGRDADPARAALARADVWWFTVAEPGRKDRILELRRRHAGEPAIGNVGPRFTPEDFAELVRARRLVIDTRDVPTDHAFLNYYNEDRLERASAAMEHLTVASGQWPVVSGQFRAGLFGPDPGVSTPAHAGTHTAERPDLLARLEETLGAPPTPEAMLPFLRDPETSVRLYAAWRLDAERPTARQRFRGEFTVREALGAIAATRSAAQAVAGTRETISP